MSPNQITEDFYTETEGTALIFWGCIFFGGGGGGGVQRYQSVWAFFSGGGGREAC